MIKLKELVQNGVQFGHQSWRWSPKMDPYIWGEKNGVHLIDVSKTAAQLEKAVNFIETIVANGEQLLFVGTKKPAQKLIQEAAVQTKSPYIINRWVGGTLTNFSQVKKSVTKLLHLEDILEKSDQYSYTKKEYVVFKKMADRLESTVGGIRDLKWPVGAVVIIDAKKEAVAIKEAQKMGIPVVALVDTNTDPTGIDYVIPGNDDAARAIKIILDQLILAVEKGKKEAKAQAKKAQEAAEKKAQAKKDEQKASAAKKTVKKSAVKAEDKPVEKKESADKKKPATKKTTAKTTATAKTTKDTKEVAPKADKKETATKKASSTQAKTAATKTTTKAKTTKKSPAKK